MAKTKYNPTFSVIIPTYNREHLVKRAIKSVLSQTYRDFEIIVVDDCSTDDTEKVIKEISKKDGRVKFVKLEENKGGAAARNKGAGVSHGKYIAFLDSDDEVMPEWLEESINRIRKLPDSWGALFSRGYSQEEFTGVVYSNTLVPKEGNVYEDLIKGKNLPVHIPGSVLKRAAFEEVRGFDENLFGFHDFDLCYRLAKEWTFHFVNVPLLLIHHHQNFRLIDDNETRKDAEWLFFEKWKGEINRIAGRNAFDKMILQRAAGLYFSHIREEVARNGRFSGIKLLFKSFSRGKFKLTYFLKNILIILVGPYVYDILKYWRGAIYWKLIR